MLAAPRNVLFLLALFYRKGKYLKITHLYYCIMCECTSGPMIVIDILKFDVRYFEEFNHASRILEYSQTK